MIYLCFYIGDFRTFDHYVQGKEKIYKRIDVENYHKLSI